MKKLVKSAVVFASLAIVGVSATTIAEKASASSIDTVQKADDQSVYIPKGVRDGTATEEHDGFEDETITVLKEVPLLRATSGYPNVNSYITTNKFSTASIEKQLKSQFPKFNYRNGYGKPEGIVIHETANNSSTITGEISYMSSNYNNAFVHAFVDKSRIIQIHPTQNGVWGAGQYANARFIQVELVRSKTFDEFARSINNYAYYTAYLLNQYKLPVDNAHGDGKGTVWSHDAVTRYLGGTTHTDPVGYFNQWGYNFTDFVSLVNQKYKAMQVTYEQIEYEKAITAYSRVKTTTGNSVWTRPNKTEGARLVNPLSSYTGKNLRIIREAKTPSALWYQFSVDGKTIGWVDSKALNTFYTPSMEKVLTGTRYVLPSKQNEHYYGLPVADSAIDRGPLSKFNGKALTLQREATIEGQLWYRVKDLGWVKAANLTTTKYDLIEYEKPITAYSRVETATGYYVWTKPNKTEGATQISALSTYSGKNLRIVREAKTPSAIWYQFSVDGKTIGWVDSKALDTFYTPSMEINFTATRYVAPGKETQHYYGLPVADSAIDRGPLSKFMGKTLTVQRKATIEGELWYRVKDLGWTKASTLTANQYDSIEYDKAITAYSRVDTAVNNSVWTKPYRTSGYALVNPLSTYSEKNMRILREAKTASGIWYQFSVDGKTIGWVDSKALDTFYTPSMEKVLTGTRYVLPSKQNEHYYGLPVADSAIDRGPLSKFNGKALTLQREATIEGQLWYRVKDLGWVKAANLSDTQYEQIEYNKAITAYSRVNTASDNYIWNNPGKTEGATQISALSAYSGKNLRIVREAKTPSAIWYQFSVDGKTIGWVDSKALDTFYTPSMEINFTATRYVAPGKETQHYYGLPVADSAIDRGPLSKFMGKTLTVQRKATIEGELWYRVKDLGWTKASTLTANQYDSIEYDKAITAYSRVDTAVNNSVWTKPYRTSGYALVNPLSTYSEKNMRILREAKTASGIWYQFSVDGKTIGWVDSKALDTFYTPSMEKVLTGTRYVLPSKQNEHYYGLPVADSAIDRGPLSKFNGKALTLQREATIEGQLWYRVKDLGWVKAANLSDTQYEQIEYNKAITAYSRVNTASDNYIWNNPGKTEGATQISALSAYSGKNLRIVREAKTPSAIWYQFSVDGKTIGWVDSKALDTFYTPSMEINFTATRYVAPGKETQHYYGLPVADSAIDRGPLSKFMGKTLTVQRKATIEGELWYRVKDLGWTKASTLTANQYDSIEYDKAITAYSRVDTAVNNSVWTKPYRTSGYALVNPLSTYSEKNMRILREAKTASGIWYQFSVDGKTIGWVDSKALDTFYTPSMEKVLTGTRYVLPSKQNEHYYGLPVADSAIDRGPLSKFNGKALTLQREATIEGQLWYRVKDLGWVKAANLSENN